MKRMINENKVHFDQAKLDAAVAKSGLSQEEFIKDQYGIDMSRPYTYKINAPGFFTFDVNQYIKKSNKINRFFQDFDAWSSDAGKIKAKLVPDLDGYIYDMPDSQVGTPVPPQPSTVTKPVVPAQGSSVVHGTTPAVKLPKPIVFDAGRDKITCTFTGKDDVKDVFTTEMACTNFINNPTIANIKADSYSASMVKSHICSYILDNVIKLFKNALADTADLHVGGEKFLVYIDSSSLIQGDISYNVVCTSNKSIKNFVVNLYSFENSVVDVVDGIEQMLANLDDKRGSVSLSDEKVTILKRTGSQKERLNNIVANYVADKLNVKLGVGVSIDAGLVLNAQSQVTAVQFTYTRTLGEGVGHDMAVDNLVNFVVKEFQGSTSWFKIIDKGFDDFGNVYVVLEISNNSFLQDMVSALKLDETFGYLAPDAQAILESSYSRMQDEIGHSVINKFFKSIKEDIESIECTYNAGRGIYECYFIFKDNVLKIMESGVDNPLYKDISLIIDEGNNMAIGYTEIAEGMGVKEIFESVGSKYSLV